MARKPKTNACGLQYVHAVAYENWRKTSMYCRYLRYLTIWLRKSINQSPHVPHRKLRPTDGYVVGWRVLCFFGSRTGSGSTTGERGGKIFSSGSIGSQQVQRQPDNRPKTAPLRQQARLWRTRVSPNFQTENKLPIPHPHRTCHAIRHTYGSLISTYLCRSCYFLL